MRIDRRLLCQAANASVCQRGTRKARDTLLKEALGREPHEEEKSLLNQSAEWAPNTWIPGLEARATAFWQAQLGWLIPQEHFVREYDTLYYLLRRGYPWIDSPGAE